MLSTNWSNYFMSRKDNVLGNQNTTVYTLAWTQSSDHATKLALLTKDPDTVIFAADTDGTMIPLHSFHNLGGTLLRPTDKIVCLIGSGHSGVAVIVDENSATADCNFVAPPADIIIAGKSPTELQIIPIPSAPTDGGIEYAGCSTFLPAPWLTDAVLAANSSDPFHLILSAGAAAKDFDDANDSDPLFLTSAKSHLEDFARWAWGVKQGKVPRTIYRLDLTDPALELFHNERHGKCITPKNPTAVNGGIMAPPPGPPPIFTTGSTPTTNDAVLHQLAASISRQSDEAAAHNELLSRQLEHNLDKEEKKKDKFKKLHSSTKQLILFASAEDADDVPTEVSEACKRFINADSTGNAEQELNLQFKNLGLQDAAFSPGLTTALYAGKFLWSDKATPSNFSPFSIFEVEPLRASDQQNRHLILHLIETQGKGKTLDEIKASCKHEVKAPTTYLEIHQQLQFFAGLCSIFFGEISIPCCAISALVSLVERNRHILKAREVDQTFMSQFLFAVDTRFQLWLDECMTLPSRNQVDDSMLNFTPLIESVRFGTLAVTLPITFVAKDKDQQPTGASSAGKRGNERKDEEKNQKKKKGRTQGREGERVSNDSPPESCGILQTETWATHFANKCISERVDWNGTCKMCPRWFIRGFCFADCFNAASHVKSTEIPPEKLDAFQQFLRKCRNA